MQSGIRSIDHRPGRARAGMSMIEIVISMSIIVIGLTTAFDAMFSSKTVNDRAHNQARAYEAIKAQIELYQYMPFKELRASFRGASFEVPGLTPLRPTIDNLSLPSGVAWPSGVPVPIGTVTKRGNAFVNNPDVTANRFTTADNVLGLTFTVRWQDGAGLNQVAVDHIFTHRGKD